jgi:hypothetical protein
MNSFSPPKRASLVVVATVAALLFAIVALWYRPETSAISANRSATSPPDLPTFEGEAVAVEFKSSELLEKEAQPAAANQVGWTIVLDEDWEAGFDQQIWTTVDQNGLNHGDYKWGTRTFENTLGGGTRSAWGIGGGEDGGPLDPANDGYPAEVRSWLMYGPVDMSSAVDAQLNFNYWFEADSGDSFSVLVSSDGINWHGREVIDGGNGTWLSRSLALTGYAGEPTVYFAFRFYTDSTGDPNKAGALVDDIELHLNLLNKGYLPIIEYAFTPTFTPTPTPQPTVTPTATPTATPIPGGTDYRDDFSSSINTWAIRRGTNGGSFSLQHRGDTDGGRQGFLEAQVFSTNSYLIASPLVQSIAPPYNIEFYAKLKEPDDRHMYGVVFGGDWNGQACDTANPANCFTRYYELRVQYRDFSGQPFQEIKLVRVDSHDSFNEPVGQILIDWTKGGNVGTDEWVEIDVFVEADGRIVVSFNDKYIAEARDTTLINNRYFGLMLITRENGNARVKFDYLKVD